MQRSKRNGGKEDCAGGEAGTTGEGRDIQFLMLIHEMFSSTKQSTVPQPAVTALLRIITHQCTPFLSHHKKTSKDSVVYS